jgi:hypothetical protein
MNMTDDGDDHLPIMTVEALITAEALSPTFRPRLVRDRSRQRHPMLEINDHMRALTTLPLSWLRALSFIIFSFKSRRLSRIRFRGVIQ